MFTPVSFTAPNIRTVLHDPTFPASPCTLLCSIATRPGYRSVWGRKPTPQYLTLRVTYRVFGMGGGGVFEIQGVRLMLRNIYS